MVTDTEDHLSLGDLASGQVTEELSGFASGSQTEDNTENLLNVGDTMSDIGRVVSQAEAGMAFSANLDAPMEGVRKLARPVPSGYARAAHTDDISMSRLADSYWKPQNASGLSEFDINDLQSMEFSTHSASNNDHGATATGAAVAQSSRALESNSADEAASRIAAHRRLGSFHSDNWHQQDGLSLPRRPESYHAVLADGPSMFDGPSGSGQQQPQQHTMSRPPSVPGNAPGERFARLAARYFNPQGGSVGHQERRSLDGISDTPDIHTAFTSGQLSMTEPSPSPPPPPQSAQAPLPSIVERTHTALQMRFASADNAIDMQRRGLYGARAQSQPSIAGSDLYSEARHQNTRRDDDMLHTGSGYPHALPTFSMESRSLESLDHPNLGSQGTLSRDNSMADSESFPERDLPFGDDDDDDDDKFGAHMINSFGNSPATPGAELSGTRAGGGGARDRMAEYDEFASVANADELFGEGHSSNPGLSDIERDHEQVFHDLFDSSDNDGDDNGRALGMSDEFDPGRPPASLFASSTSIVAEIRRRNGQQNPRPQRGFTSWDGREATPETLRRQEHQYSENNPIDMMNKSNSLGISDQDVSGLLPETEFSPARPDAVALFAKNNVLGRVHPGLPTPQTAFSGAHALFSPAMAQEPPPPTTPTTFISRDTRRRPSSRVLHRVPPFDPTSSRTSMTNEHAAASQGFDDSHATVRRPAGPRAQGARPPMLSIPQRQTSQRNARAAAEFAQATRASSNAITVAVAAPLPSEQPSMTSSLGMGSLLQDSLPNLDISRISRTPNTPLRLLSRSANPSPLQSREWQLNQSGSSRATSNANYVPFQDPTVDVSQLARYNAVDIGEGAAPGQQQQQHLDGTWLLNKQRSGVSADRMDSPARWRVPLVGDREIRSRQDDDSDMVATIRFDSPTPPATARGSSRQSGARAGAAGVGMASGRRPPVPGRREKVEGPTLADIYNLLKKTVSSLDGQRQGGPPAPDGSQADYVVPYQLRTDAHDDTAEQSFADQPFPDNRPSAPTPRRSRMFPHVAEGLGAATSNTTERYAYAAGLRRTQTASGLGHLSSDHADPVQTRFQQHLQRYTSDSVIGGRTVPRRRHTPLGGPGETWNGNGNGNRADAPSQAAQNDSHAERSEVGAVDAGSVDTTDIEALGSLLRSTGIRNEEIQNIPLPLAEKLLELTATLARDRRSTGATRAVDSAVQTSDEWRDRASGGNGEQHQEDMLRLQQGIMAKLDEYRAEVDLLRTEVRQGSSVATAPGSLAARRGGANGSSIAPHDSVSFAAARGAAGMANAGGDDDNDDELAGYVGSDDAKRFLTPSPRPASETRPLYTVPTTVKNRQRHMVQWLTQHDGPPGPHSNAGSVGRSASGSRRRSQDAQVFTTPSLQRTRAGRVADDLGSPTRRSSGRVRHRATAEDADEGGPDYYRDHLEALVDGAAGGHASARGKGVDIDSADEALSDASTTVPEYPSRMRMRSPVDPAMISPANVPSQRQLRPGWHAARRDNAAVATDARDGGGDLLQTRETLDSVRRRWQKGGGDGDERLVYSKQMTQQLAQTLAELQHAHLSHFHGLDARGGSCLVCAALEAQNHDPYLFGRHAVAYKSMSTRELQSLLNAYVAAMEDELGPRAAKAFAGARRPHRRAGGDGGDADALGYTRQGRQPAHHSFTPTRGRSGSERAGGGKPTAAPALGAKDAQATRMVIGLLHEELGALSRRYHRMVDEYHGLDPSHAEDQRRRRQMARELKDLVDLLDVKGEQIAVLAGLHPSLKEDAGRLRASDEPLEDSPRRKPGSIERAFQSAKALQQALGDLY
ncbi:hypothetical protein LPJ61_001370 [Coemansia biformis]|uniref:Cep57 centrosome microtubule-binding domain-containing protein n=1 Tax=Coemansia biformis TaxID=1286918 RepID=A0A9W7YF06_9FUNG|nr:hypothetical protein LPJ61_001370 [Coemansia biformis]